MQKGRKQKTLYVLTEEPRTRPKKRRKAAGAAAAFVILAAVLLSAAGFMTADYNSRVVGWNFKGTEFAFKSTDNRIDFTVMGGRYYIETGFVTQAGNVVAKVFRGAACLEPAPLRLAGMLGEWFQKMVSYFKP